MKRFTFLLSLLLSVTLSASAAPSHYFVPNQGQLHDTKGLKHPEIKFKYEGEGMNLYFLEDKLIYHFIRTEEKKQNEFSEKDRENYRNGNFSAIGKKVFFYRLDLHFKGANKNVEIITGDKMESYSNYYLSSCPDGLLNVSHYEKIIYRNLYDGIDLAFYFKDGKLKYDLIVSPGADISKIKFEYEGAESIEKLASGELVIKTPAASLTEGKPYTYHEAQGTELPSEYVLNGSEITFNVAGEQAGSPIIIDPTVTWSTYFNNGSSSDTWTKPDFDATGAFYNAGYTYYTTFPLINAGAGQYYDSSKDGITDLVVVKFSSTYAYTWATYYGGDGGEYVAGYTDYGKALAVDGNNNVFFAGQTDGTVFPTYNPGGGAFYQDQTKIHSETAFVVKLNSSGVRLWASMFQHENANTMSSSIRINGILAANNNLYFTGQTYRFNSNDVPLRTLAGAYNNPTWRGPQDVFIGRFTSTSALDWCTYLNDGGLANASYRQGCDLTMDGSGNLWFVGRHSSSAANAGHYLLNPGGGAYYQGTNNGDQDLIITKFNSTLNPVYSTYYGGNDQDIPSMIECNSVGDAVITLRAARSTNLPVYDPGGGAYYQPTKAYISSFDSDAAILKLSTAGVRQWATYYGGSAGPSLFSGVGFDASNNIYVFGSTQASNFPTQTEASSYNDAILGGTGDVVLLRFTNGGVRQWSTFYGGSGSESLYSPKGEVAASGCSVKLLSMPYTSSADFPTTNPGGGAFFESTALTANVNTIMLFEESSAGGNSTAPTSASAGSATICSGNSTTLTVSGGSLGTGASWNWYSGSCGGTLVGTGASITVSPATTTTYYVRAEGTCNTTTCASVTVTVNTSSTAATSAAASAPTICTGGSTTLSLSGGSLGTGAVWNWYSGSCGGTLVGTGTSVTVSPAVTTTYYVRAEGTCNTTTCASVTVTVNTSSTAPASAAASSPSICTGGTATLSVSGGSLGTGATWNWYSGSCGGTLVGTGASITVSPATTTTYYVRAEGTCNTTTCASVTVTVNTNSTAASGATATPSAVCAGSPTTLFISGGLLGTGANWAWYSGSCGGTPEGTGASITVSPTVTTTYYVRAEGTCNTTTCASVTVTVNTSSTAPASAAASSPTICQGSTTTLSVSGGTLGSGANWTWYSGSCGGTLEGTGASLVVSPSATTTYYVRAEGTCNNTTCASVTVTVNTNSTAAAAASATPSSVCSPGSTTLSITGGSLGTGATWNWYDGSCNGTLVGTGSSISVTPSASTTYYVNASGTCNTTACQSVAVTFNTPSTAPASAAASSPVICQGSSTTLSVSGGTLGSGANWTWYSGSCGGTLEGTGASLAVSPSATTTYYVRAEGACNNTTCASVTVTVNTNSTAAASATASATAVCASGTSTLSVSGGSLGTGADWNWYDGSCNGTLIGTGNSITVSPSATTTYYVNAVGTCNTTTCQSVTVSLSTSSTAPTAATASSPNICPSGSSTLTASGGSLGTNAVYNWYEGSCGGTLVGTGASITVSPASTTTYYVRAEGDCNITGCASVTVTVDALSTDPSGITASATSVCTGNNVTLTVNGGSLGTGADWNWYSGSCNGTLVGTGASVTVPVNANTDFYVNAAGSCNTTACAQVSISTIPGTTLPSSLSASANPVCPGTPVTITMNGGALEAGAGWVWYSGSCGGTPEGTGNSITVTPSSTTTYFVRAEGGSCGNSACVSVTVNVDAVSTDPVSAAASASPVCPGSSVTLSVNGGTLGTGAQYTWYDDTCNGNMIGTGTSITVTPSAATTYFVNIVGTCNITICQQVQVNMEQVNIAPVSITASDTNLCSSSSITLSVNGGTLGTGGQWEWYEGSCGGTVVGTGTSITVAPTAPTSYFVGAVGGCNTTACVSTNIQATPIPAAWNVPASAICSSVPSILLDTLLVPSTLTNGTWYGQGVTGNMFDPTGLTGTITLSYVTGTGICMDSVAQNVTINPAPAAPAVSTSNDSICAGASVTLDATGSGTGAVYNIYASATGGASIGSTPMTVTPSSTTTYYIEAVDTTGCANDGGRQPLTIVASPPPNANAGADQSLCDGSSATLTATGGGTYMWSTGATTASITVSPAADSTYVVIVDVNGCTNTDTVNVDVITSADVSAANDNSTAMQGVQVTVDVASNDTGDANTVMILSGPFNGTASVNASGQIIYTSNASFSGIDSLTYSICNANCATICTTATVVITVNAELDVVVPGGISPNGDGINDVLNIQGLSAYPEHTLIIFNRWGDEVFSASPYNNDWRGQSNNPKLKVMGDEVVDGTYFYILKLTPDDKGMNGTIELIRK